MTTCHICDAVPPAHNLTCPRAKGNRPTVGREFVWGDQTIVPSYVRESESPREDGACVTDLAGGDFKPRGWYVEYHYPDDHLSHRGFVPFDHKES